MDALRNFLVIKGTKDLASVITPDGLKIMKWKSAIDPGWLLKVAPLVYDILAFAPNSKISGKKWARLWRSCSKSCEITNGTTRETKDFLDYSGLFIRIALSQFRTLKIDLKGREKTFRLEKQDKTRFNLILERMLLPPDFDDKETDDERDVDWVHRW